MKFNGDDIARCLERILKGAKLRENEVMTSLSDFSMCVEIIFAFRKNIMVSIEREN